jgi:cyclic dehypoxanthinyl futalosine synthase
LFSITFLYWHYEDGALSACLQRGIIIFAGLVKDMPNDKLIKIVKGHVLSAAEGLELYRYASTAGLCYVADELRKKIHPGNNVGWIIDRNVNITNICFSRCHFCNFCRKKGDPDAYITTRSQYRQKIKELFSTGGDQLLLQGGMHPDLGLDFYKQLFRELKTINPLLKLHALGPPEIVHIANLEQASIETVLKELVSSGLESLPGAGAEILSDRVRKEVSPAKATTSQWLDVMRQAHKMNLPTSATMMFGHIETDEERIEHLVKLRELQAEKPNGYYGFLSFIPWTFQDEGTWLKEKKGISNTVNAEEYIRTIAISRIMLDNIPNIQASWLTVGKEVGQVCLHAGANDFGSVMIEENVVSSAGASYSMGVEEIQMAIKEAGFVPYRRNQKFETGDW